MSKENLTYVLRHRLNLTAFWDNEHGWVYPEKQYTYDERKTLKRPPDSVWVIVAEH